jgi:hypothetical protein
VLRYKAYMCKRRVPVRKVQQSRQLALDMSSSNLLCNALLLMGSTTVAVPTAFLNAAYQYSHSTNPLIHVLMLW